MEKGLTKEPTGVGFQVPSPLLPAETELDSRPPSLCLVRTLDHCLVPNTKEMSLFSPEKVSFGPTTWQ